MRHICQLLHVQKLEPFAKDELTVGKPIKSFYFGKSLLPALYIEKLKTTRMRQKHSSSKVW